MNKKMRELLAQLEQKQLMAKGFMDGEHKDLAKADSLLNEADEIRKEFEIEKRLFEAEKADNAPTEDDLVKANTDETADGFVTVSKMMQGKPLSEKEKALILDGVDGENYLVPEDVRLEINELRRTYVSAKDIVTVTPTSFLTGTTNWEDGPLAGLTPLEDGQEIAFGDQPKFSQKSWKIGFFSKMIPVSRLLQGAEKAGLLSYINRWFIKNAIFTENNAIFDELKRGKTVKAVQGWEALKRSINTELDPALLIGGVIVTNQTGFAILDEEKDATGRPILKENPQAPTEKIFQGLPIRVFTDAQLPNVEGKAPMFYGNTHAGVEFHDYLGLEFATSEHFLFNKNQTAIRVIEGFDVNQVDAESYIYATFEATPAPVATEGN